MVVIVADDTATVYSCVCIALADLQSATNSAIRAFQMVNGGTITNSGTVTCFVIVTDYFLGGIHVSLLHLLEGTL